MSGERRKTVAVLFGGRSLEHDVSVVSGLQIVHALDPVLFDPVPVYLDQSLRWWTGDALWDRAQFGPTGPSRATLREVMLAPGFGTSALVPVEGGPRRTIDAFIPVLHGTFGEDGCVQAALELAGAAYVGSGVLASAIGMNKRATKVLAQQAGVPVVPWRAVRRGVLDEGGVWLTTVPAEIETAFGWPVIVKPCNLGSSAGVSVARDAASLVAGLLTVFEYDTEAIIEPFVQQRLEVNVAVAGLDTPVASVTEMPVTSDAAPLSFSEKYRRSGGKSVGSSQGMASLARILDPQALPLSMREEAQRHAVTVFATLGCEGIARIDFLIDGATGALYFNEINTVPGSLAFYLWSAPPHHWTMTDLLSRLVERAERRRAMLRGLQRTPPSELSLLS